MMMARMTAASIPMLEAVLIPPTAATVRSRIASAVTTPRCVVVAAVMAVTLGASRTKAARAMTHRAEMPTRTVHHGTTRTMMATRTVSGKTTRTARAVHHGTAMVPPRSVVSLWTTRTLMRHRATMMTSSTVHHGDAMTVMPPMTSSTVHHGAAMPVISAMTVHHGTAMTVKPAMTVHHGTAMTVKPAMTVHHGTAMTVGSMVALITMMAVCHRMSFVTTMTVRLRTVRTMGHWRMFVAARPVCCWTVRTTRTVPHGAKRVRGRCKPCAAFSVFGARTRGTTWTFSTSLRTPIALSLWAAARFRPPRRGRARFVRRTR
jgi:hypothetical protein